MQYFEEAPRSSKPNVTDSASGFRRVMGEIASDEKRRTLYERFAAEVEDRYPHGAIVVSIEGFQDPRGTDPEHMLRGPRRLDRPGSLIHINPQLTPAIRVTIGRVTKPDMSSENSVRMVNVAVLAATRDDFCSEELPPVGETQKWDPKRKHYDLTNGDDLAELDIFFSGRNQVLMLGREDGIITSASMYTVADPKSPKRGRNLSGVYFFEEVAA